MYKCGIQVLIGRKKYKTLMVKWMVFHNRHLTLYIIIQIFINLSIYRYRNNEVWWTSKSQLLSWADPIPIGLGDHILLGSNSSSRSTSKKSYGCEIYTKSSPYNGIDLSYKIWRWKWSTMDGEYIQNMTGYEKTSVKLTIVYNIVFSSSIMMGKGLFQSRYCTWRYTASTINSIHYLLLKSDSIQEFIMIGMTLALIILHILKDILYRVARTILQFLWA